MIISYVHFSFSHSLVPYLFSLSSYFLSLPSHSHSHSLFYPPSFFLLSLHSLHSLLFLTLSFFSFPPRLIGTAVTKLVTAVPIIQTFSHIFPLSFFTLPFFILQLFPCFIQRSPSKTFPLCLHFHSHYPLNTLSFSLFYKFSVQFFPSQLLILPFQKPYFSPCFFHSTPPNRFSLHVSCTPHFPPIVSVPLLSTFHPSKKFHFNSRNHFCPPHLYTIFFIVFSFQISKLYFPFFSSLFHFFLLSPLFVTYSILVQLLPIW